MHDPEDELSLQDVSTMSVLQAASPSSGAQMFYPYPNCTAFRLGDWFWNGGVQKSQASFREFVDIIGDPEYHPADIRNVQWDHINRELSMDDEGEWLDEDAGWIRTSVTISVPYQLRRGVMSEPEAGP